MRQQCSRECCHTQVSLGTVSGPILSYAANFLCHQLRLAFHSHRCRRTCDDRSPVYHSEFYWWTVFHSIDRRPVYHHEVSWWTVFHIDRRPEAKSLKDMSPALRLRGRSIWRWIQHSADEREQCCRSRAIQIQSSKANRCDCALLIDLMEFVSLYSHAVSVVSVSVVPLFVISSDGCIIIYKRGLTSTNLYVIGRT